MAKVFISHSSADKPFVRKLSQDLELLGNSVWLDEWHIKVGDRIVAKVQQGLENSDLVILVLTHQSASSSWVRDEWQSRYWDEVQSRRLTVLPILLEDCTVPILLRQKKYADFRDAAAGTRKYAVGLANLAKSIQAANNGAGISAYYPDVVDADVWNALFRNTTSLDLVIMYANTWRNTHRKQIINVLESGGVVRIVLPDVEHSSALAWLYATQLGTTPNGVEKLVKDATIDFTKLSTYGKIRIFISRKYFTQAMYLFDGTGILALYSYREDRVPTPAFAVEDGDLLRFLRTDFEWLVSPDNASTTNVFP